MRHVAVFCAITFGMGCGASAAEMGLASFYGLSHAGELTAAHRSLPKGTQVRVVNLDNGRSAVVRIVDRGPFIRGRIIDVSTATAVTLGFRQAGLAHVRIDLIAPTTAEAGLPRARRSASPSYQAVAYEICRYGAGRVEILQRGPDGATLARVPMACESLPARLFIVAQNSEDLSPFVARGGGFLTETEAAARIPVNAVAAVPERVTPAPRSADGCGAQGESAALGCEEVRARLLVFAERSRGLAPVAAHGGAVLADTDVAASIPVTALAEVPAPKAPAARPSGDCGGASSCASREQTAAATPDLSFLDRLRRFFD